MEKPKKVCYVLEFNIERIPVNERLAESKRFDKVAEMMTNAWCSLAGTYSANPLPGLWYINGYDDWKETIRRTFDDLEEDVTVNLMGKWITPEEADKMKMLALYPGLGRMAEARKRNKQQ